MNHPVSIKIFKHTVLALAISAASGTLLAQDVVDASDDDMVIEEVIVTGMRASVLDALARKRNSDQIVDAISSEDIGKLPDENIGEALQRIPGITISREAGEGKEVSVRGLGPSLTLVTVNGQQMASTEGSRAVNFSVLDSSMVSALEVWKSPMARQDEGAVGGTINIITRSPLSYNNTRTNLSAQGQYEQLSDKWGGRFTGNVLTQNEAKTFGFAISANYSDRTSRSDQVVIPGWTLQDPSTNDWKSRGWDDLAAAKGLDYIYYPMDASSRVRLYDRKRWGITPTFQWRPNDDLEINLYGLYSKLEDHDENQTAQVRIRDLVRGNGRDVNDYDWEFDGNVASFFDATDAKLANGWRGYRNIASLRENSWTNKGANFTVDWNVNDTNLLYFAAGTSKGKGQLNTYPVSSFEDSVGFSVDLRDDPRFPQSIINGGGTDDSLMDLRTLSVNDQENKEKKTYAQMDWTGDTSWWDVASFQAGVKYKKDTTDHVQTRHVSNNVSSAGYTLADFAKMCGDNTCVFKDFEYANDTLPPLNGSFTQVDFDELESAFPRDSRETSIRYNESFKVSEKTWAGYLQANLDGLIGNTVYRGNIGLRIYETKLTSSGWLDQDGTISGVVDRKYSDLLPSLNLAFILKDDLILRTGLAKVISRPDQEDLALAGTYNLANETARVGNPFLRPFKARTADLGIEWYFSDVGMISAGLFYKDIESFISNGVIEGGIPVDTGEGIVIFDATGPINGDGGTVKGLEVGYQQIFDSLPGFWGGFGTQINYTYTDSDVSIPYFEGELVYSMPLEELSKNSLNFTLFWESDSFSARIAYNYRDSFLSNRANTQGNPVFTDDYGQLDAGINWTINKTFTLSLDAINLNNEARYQYFLEPSRMLAWRASGRRYTIGLRARF